MFIIAIYDDLISYLSFKLNSVYIFKPEWGSNAITLCIYANVCHSEWKLFYSQHIWVNNSPFTANLVSHIVNKKLSSQISVKILTMLRLSCYYINLKNENRYSSAHIHWPHIGDQRETTLLLLSKTIPTRFSQSPYMRQTPSVCWKCM